MAEADGYIRIDTKLDDTGLIKKLASINEKINRQTLALEKAKETAAALSEELARVSQPGYMSKEAKALEKELANSEKTVAKLQQKFDAIADELEEKSELNINGNYDEEIERLRESLGPVSAELDNAKQRAEELRQALAFAKENPASSQEAQDIGQQLRLADENVKRLEADLSNSRQLLSSMRQPAEEVTTAIEKTKTSTGGLTDYMKRLAKRMLLLYAFRRVFTYIRQTIMSLSGLSVVTGAFQDFNNKIKEAYASNEQIQASLARLRGALYMAFTPIYSAVVPALVSLINWLARGISYIAAFFSALSGKSLAESTAGANKLAKAVGGVGGAAKEANKELASFDKLNTLSENKGGGGGGGGGGAGADFGVDPDENKLALWEKIGTRIREIIQSIKDRIQEFIDWWDTATPEQKAVVIIAALSILIPLLFLLLSWPLAMVAALLVLIAVVEKYYEQITGWLDGAYKKINEFFDNATQEITEHISNARKWLTEHAGWLGGIFAAILSIVEGVLLTGFHIVQTVFNLILNVINAVVQTIHAIATGDWKSAWDAWGQVFTDLWEGVKQIVFDILNALIGAFEGFINSAIGWINTLLDGINTVGSLLGRSWNLGISTVSIPRFASGGFPDAGSLFIAGEAGPELVGSFGGSSNAVVNEAQLAQAFQQASSAQVALLQEQNSLLSAILRKSGVVTFKPSSEAGRAFQQSINMYSRAMGV